MSAFEGADCQHCEQLPPRMLRSRLSLFYESGRAREPQGAGPAAAEAARRSHTWGSQMDLSAGLEMGPALSPPLSVGSIALLPVSEARPAASTARGESPMLRCSSSEEVDVLSIGDSGTFLHTGNCKYVVLGILVFKASSTQRKFLRKGTSQIPYFLHPSDRL
jgi:hypothetical protein